MKALVLKALHDGVHYIDVPDPEPADDEVVVRLHAAALNHRDVWITKGMYPGIRFPSVLGSDGVGTVDGRPVMINPSVNWGDSERFQSDAFEVLGMPTAGTFAEAIAIPKGNLVDRPAHLNDTEAAALPLAGLTAYRALVSRAGAGAGDRVLVTGIGGGVALFAMQFALALGASVYVTSRSDEKIGRAIELGAAGGANYRKDDWDARLKEAAGGFDVIIDSACGPGFSKLIGLANMGGRIAFFGGTAGPVERIDPFVVFWRQLSILGSTMGSPADFSDMLNLVETHRIVPVVDRVFPLAEGNDALAHMDASGQFGKIVLTV